ncbi:efflux RND transporter periplasmic adaptor subunit [soil metagenome]
MRIRNMLAGGLILVGSAAMAQGPGAKGGPPMGPPPPPKVTFVTVSPKSVPVAQQFVGLTEPSRTVEVRARIRGFIEKRLFEEGAQVKEGDLLYKIDPREFAADVDVAAAQVAQAESRVTLAQQELDRLTRLRSSGAIAQADIDRAQSEKLSAEASRKVAEAQLDKVKLELGYAEIHAPMAGIVGKAQKDEGALVDSAENSLLTMITRISPIYATMRVSEGDYMAWKNAQHTGKLVKTEGAEEVFHLVLQDGSVFEEAGKLNFESAGFRPETGTYEVRAEFANASGRLRPGQFVRVRVEGWEKPNTISVPQRGVMHSPNGSSVYVIGEGKKLAPRGVVLGEWAGDDWVIQSGLQTGDKVLVDGLGNVFQVHPGTVVEPIPYTATPKAAYAGKELSAPAPEAAPTATPAAENAAK